MKKFSFEKIISLINCDYKIQGFATNNYVTNVKSVSEADEYTLMWINQRGIDKEKVLNETKANIIICDDSLSLNKIDINKKVLIQVKDPKLVFVQLVSELFVKNPEYGIHPSAVIHPEAKIAKKVFIGPNTYVGKSEIKEGTIIYGNVYIYDNVRIGRNVKIEAGVVIGNSCFNYSKDENGNLHSFPHLGGVIINDNVDILTNSAIAKGVLEDTVIGVGTKIGSYSYIGHNCKIGKNNAITGVAVFLGSSKIGDNCWISPGALIRDGITIESNSFVGMNSTVNSSLEANSKVMGFPARPTKEMKKIIKKLNKLINDEE